MAALGRRLRTRRAARDDTLAAVAERAGLSVPYIANLENGRGNPTLAALDRLVTALGARLTLDLADPDTPTTGSEDPPAALLRFAQTHHFQSAVRRIADTTDRPATAVRARLLAAMGQLAALAPDGRTTERDWYRVLDAAVLIATHD